MGNISVKRLSPALGADVDFDLSRLLTEEDKAELVALFNEHHLLLFRGQTFSEDQQVAFSKLFGPVSHRSPAMKTRDVAFVSNALPEGVLGDGELLFHSDNTFFQYPLKAIGLYAMQIPSIGGDTLFSNAYRVYDALPPEIKSQLQSLTSLQVFDYNGDYNRRSTLEAAPPDASRAQHPLTWRNPTSGRVALFLSEHTTVRINGLSREEETALIDLLRSYIEDSRFCYRHKWTVGDFVFWDNVCLQHARETFDRKQARTLRRTPILDPDGPARFPDSLDLTRSVA